jgi:hypothetical protein
MRHITILLARVMTLLPAWAKSGYKSPPSPEMIPVNMLCFEPRAFPRLTQITCNSESNQSRDRQWAANGGCEAILSARCLKTLRPTINATLIDGLSCCARSGVRIGLLGVCRDNGR